MRPAPAPALGGAIPTPNGACARARSAERLKQQEAVLERAAALVKPGGRIAYITCSVLAEENGDQVRAFVGRHARFFRGKARQRHQRPRASAPIFSAAPCLSRTKGC